jgi:glycine cleavage system transcriptional repressor
MEQLMVISAVGGDRTGVVHELTRVILDCGGNIRESRMTALGSEFAMLLLVAGNWHTISRMERELNRFAEAHNLTVQLKRTEPRKFGKELLPYAIDVVCLDQPGIVHSLAGFFSTRDVEIGEVTTRSYAAAHTGAPMFSVQMLVNIPAGVHISGLREEFMEFCDQLNVDAILEPVKHS